MKQMRRLLGLSLVLTSAACGAPGEDELEGIDTATAAVGETTCLSAPTDSPTMSGPAQSPTTYNNAGCPKSFIFEDEGVFPASTGGAILWTDPWNRNEIQCRNGLLKFQFMSRSATSTGSYRDEGTFTFPLFWDAPQATCWYPFIEFTQISAGAPTLFSGYVPATGSGGRIAPSIPGGFMNIPMARSLAGRHVRIAAQALTPRRSTQSVSVAF